MVLWSASRAASGLWSVSSLGEAAFAQPPLLPCMPVSLSSAVGWTRSSPPTEPSEATRPAARATHVPPDRRVRNLTGTLLGLLVSTNKCSSKHSTSLSCVLSLCLLLLLFFSSIYVNFSNQHNHLTTSTGLSGAFYMKCWPGLGLGGTFVDWVKLLYSSPKAFLRLHSPCAVVRDRGALFPHFCLRWS